MLEMDHLVVAAEHLEEGVAYTEGALGVKLSPGGKHALMGTHNALLSLGPGLCLEVIAIDPDAPSPDRARWFGLDEFSGKPRLTNWVCRSDDLVNDLARAPDGMGKIVEASRGALRWQMVVPDLGQYPLDGAFPGMIQWREGGHPSERLPDLGVRLEMLEIDMPDVEKLNDALSGMFESDKLQFGTAKAKNLAAHFMVGEKRVTLT